MITIRRSFHHQRCHSWYRCWYMMYGYYYFLMLLLIVMMMSSNDEQFFFFSFSQIKTTIGVVEAANAKRFIINHSSSATCSATSSSSSSQLSKPTSIFSNFISTPFTSTSSSTSTATSTVWYELQPTLTQYDEDFFNMKEEEKENIYNINNKKKNFQKQFHRFKPIFGLKQQQHKQQQQQKYDRKIFWFGRYDEEMTWRINHNNNHNKLSSLYDRQQQQQQDASSLLVNNNGPHPLRTDLWNLKIHWKESLSLSSSLWEMIESSFRSNTNETLIEFHVNGYCRSPTLGIGTWEMYPWGIRCTLSDETLGVEYTLYASLHLNPFGKHPKLLQGTIIKEEYCSGGGGGGGGVVEDPIQDHLFIRYRKKWFRPVVATFSGQGIGIDSADFSYSKRGVGLSQ